MNGMAFHACTMLPRRRQAGVAVFWNAGWTVALVLTVAGLPPFPRLFRYLCIPPPLLGDVTVTVTDDGYTQTAPLGRTVCVWVWVSEYTVTALLFNQL